MSNTSEYQVTFSYDLNQTGGKKYDSFIKMIGEKHGAVLEKVYEDEYGGKDLAFNSISDLYKLNSFVKDVFQDLNKKDVKVSANGSKHEYVLKITQKQIKDKIGFDAVVQGWGNEKNVKIENNGITTDLIFSNKVLKEDFVNNVLPQTSLYTKGFQAPTVEEDWKITPVSNGNNYGEKRANRI